jgi:DNA-binding response OmpR family regulator
MKTTNFSPGPKPTRTPPSRLVPSQRILVVDDEPLIRQLNSEILADAGFVVDVAEDGAAAWDALQLNNYDLLVTDNQMPKVSGVDLVTKIRDASMNLPVIMATGSLPGEEFEQHHWLQPFAILLKPYSLAELVETVKTILSLNQAGGGPVTLVPNWECQPLAFGVRLS